MATFPFDARLGAFRIHGTHLLDKEFLVNEDFSNNKSH
jgi:hypothetical protein